jgi:hypothetical protein
MLMKHQQAVENLLHGVLAGFDRAAFQKGLAKRETQQ